MKGGTQHTFFQNSSMGCQNVKLTDSSQKSGNTCKMCLILCSTVSFHTALSHSMQCRLQWCLIPCSVSFHTALSDSMQCCLISYGVVSFHAVLSHSIRHCLIPCSVVSFHTVLSHSLQCCQYPQVRLGCGFPLHLEQGKQLL